MSDYKLAVVPVNLIPVLWDQMIVHLQPVVDVGHGEISLDSIKNRAMDNCSVLVVVTDGNAIVAVTTAEVVTYDSGLKSLLVPIFGGKGLFEWGEEWFELHKIMARDLGCSEIRGLAVRDGWMKILKSRGWTENQVVITYKLDQE